VSVPESLCLSFALKVNSIDFSFGNSATVSLLAVVVQHCGQDQQLEKVVADASNTLQRAHNRLNSRTAFAGVKLLIRVSMCVQVRVGRNGRRHARTETMLCWIRANLLRGYEASVKHKRIRDRYAGSRHLKNIRFRIEDVDTPEAKVSPQWPVAEVSLTLGRSGD
jgi:hypothetical protein